MAPSDLTPRFHALRDVLATHAGLWRPAPFHHVRPAWCEAYPDLSAYLLGLADGQVTALGDDNHALIDLLAAYIPALGVLHELIRIPAPAASRGETAPARLLAQVPGRKVAQIIAFAEAVGEVGHPMLEWCAGKGHLGRLLAWRQPHPVTSLELDPALVEAGVDLARRSGLAQNFLREDALSSAAATHLANHHAVALHACGDLHLALLKGAVDQRAPALDLAPCCYYRTRHAAYQPLCEDGGLSLSRDELHLAVTETVTAGSRDRRRSDTLMAWKLAFLELRAEGGVPQEKTFKPVPDAWMAWGFAGWVQRLCGREGVPIQPQLDWARLEQSGWCRHAEVRRLELVRLAFRRPLELWLVLDRALFLERHGYRIQLREFCGRGLTPRNLMISARLEQEFSEGGQPRWGPGSSNGPCSDG